eukprot:COSAG02_NODE_350_length_24063_cov_47.131447_14_plen_58_part_00
MGWCDPVPDIHSGFKLIQPPKNKHNASRHPCLVAARPPSVLPAERKVRPIFTLLPVL